jgi:DNA end-binding protein Ku
MAKARKQTKTAQPKEAARGRAKAPVPGLSARPVWLGHLRLSLVSCPVALYKATSKAAEISFHLLNPETNNRIRMVPTDPETGAVPRSDLVRGYEIEKNRYVVLDDEELESVKLETTHTLDIERFVEAGSIDRLFWADPYILMPTDDIAVSAYGVIREAMKKTGRIALGRVVMHTRERLMGIEPRDNGLVAYTLRMRDEVVNLEKALDSIPHAKPNRQMVDIAEKIIEQLDGPFAPDEFRDRYEESLRDLIARKEKGEKTTVAAPAAEPSNVIDLMAALRKSLGSKAAAVPKRQAALAVKRPGKRTR